MLFDTIRLHLAPSWRDCSVAAPICETPDQKIHASIFALAMKASSLSGRWLLADVESNRTFEYVWQHTPGAKNFQGQQLGVEGMFEGHYDGTSKVSWQIGHVSCHAKISGDDLTSLIDGEYFGPHGKIGSFCGEKEAPRSSEHDGSRSVFAAWAQLCLLFSIWLEFAYDMGRHGRRSNHGKGRMYLYQYSTWAADLRHVATALARHWISSSDMPSRCEKPELEWSLAQDFLAMMDLSVEALQDGEADTDVRRSLLSKCYGRWQLLEARISALHSTDESELAVAVSPDSAPIDKKAEARRIVDLDPMEDDVGFTEYFYAMSQRRLPDTFCGLWGRGTGVPMRRTADQTSERCNTSYGATSSDLAPLLNLLGSADDDPKYLDDDDSSSAISV